jgi:carbon-monoxide dehydrogenase large subunit
MGAKHFGARVTRLEDPALLSGRGRFVDDVKLPGVLQACFVRSPYAHAQLLGIDGKSALELPGVHAVVVANDLPDPMRSEAMPMLLPNPSISALCTQHVLAREEVFYVGQPVAVVIADTRYIAEDAAAAVVAHYDVLPAVGDCRDAAAEGAPQAHAALPSNVLSTFRLAYGDVDAAFAATCSRRRSGSIAAAAWRWRPARCWRATIRRPICSRFGRAPRRRISAAACWPI